MKRFHVHVSVENLDGSIEFYSTLLGSQPTVRKPDYAKWMLNDPSVNFAISNRGHRAGVNHLGIQADTAEDLREIAARISQGGEPTLSQRQTTCCYATSDKHWLVDPQGLAWETFHTTAEAASFGEDAGTRTGGVDVTESACCILLYQGVAQGDRSKPTESACCVPHAERPAVGGCC